MKKIIISLLAILFLIPGIIKSQDVIYKITGDSIICNVHEVGINEIKYTLLDFSQTVVFGIEKDKVQSIVFSDGAVIEFQKEIYNEGKLRKR